MYEPQIELKPEVHLTPLVGFTIGPATDNDENEVPGIKLTTFTADTERPGANRRVGEHQMNADQALRLAAALQDAVLADRAEKVEEYLKRQVVVWQQVAASDAARIHEESTPKSSFGPYPVIDSGLAVHYDEAVKKSRLADRALYSWRDIRYEGHLAMSVLEFIRFNQMRGINEYAYEVMRTVTQILNGQREN